MRIRVSGSTSATKSLSPSVSVILSWSESSGVKLYESVTCETDDSQCEVSFNTFGKELFLVTYCSLVSNHSCLERKTIPICVLRYILFA